VVAFGASGRGVGAVSWWRVVVGGSWWAGRGGRSGACRGRGGVVVVRGRVAWGSVAWVGVRQAWCGVKQGMGAGMRRAAVVEGEGK